MKFRRRDPSSVTPAASAAADSQAALRRLSETRPDRVALARRLIADPNYPSRATLRRVAAVIAREISPDKPPGESVD